MCGHCVLQDIRGSSKNLKTNSRRIEPCSMQCVFSVIVKRRSIRTLFMAYAFWHKPRTKCLLQGIRMHERRCGCASCQVCVNVLNAHVSALDRTLSERS
jgi:hypothetical protein